MRTPAWGRCIGSGVAVLSLLLCACTQSNDKAVKNPRVYTLLNASDVDTLDPGWANDTTSINVLFQIYEPLIYFRGSSLVEFEPRLAEKVPSFENNLISPDGLTYRFPIREGAHFHDGSSLTPEDVKYSLMRFCLLDRAGGPSRTMLEVLAGRPSTRIGGKLPDDVFDKLDKAIQIEGRAVIVRLTRPFLPFLALAANRWLVVSRQWAARNGGWDGSRASWKRYNDPAKTATPFFDRANGTGPFKLERWSRESKQVHLVRNEAYWRTPARLKRVVIRAVPEFSTRRLMLGAGDADAIFADRTQLAELRGLPGVTLIDDLPSTAVNPVVFFVFRVQARGNPYLGSGKLDGKGTPPDFFRDAHVRKAFAHSFDYDGYIRDVLRGKGSRARGVVPKGLLGYDEGLPVYDYDPERAKRHFRKAWGGAAWERGFRMTVAYNSGSASRRVIAEMLKRSIERLNPKFRIDVRGIQWSAYLERMKNRKLPLFISGVAPEYPDPHFFAFHLLHSRGIFSSRQGFRDAMLDGLIEQALQEGDTASRERLYAEVQQRVHALAPQLYVADSSHLRVQRDWVRGWTHQPMFPNSPHGCYLYPLYKESSSRAGRPGAERPTQL